MSKSFCISASPSQLSDPPVIVVDVIGAIEVSGKTGVEETSPEGVGVGRADVVMLGLAASISRRRSCMRASSAGEVAASPCGIAGAVRSMSDVGRGIVEVVERNSS